MKVKEAKSLLEKVKNKVQDTKQQKKIGELVESSMRKYYAQHRFERPMRKGEFELSPTLTSKVKPESLRKADDLYILSSLLKADPRDLQLWKTCEGEISELRKAMDTQTAAEGFEWIPTGFSNDLIERVKLALKVAGLFRRFNMPTPTYRFPAQGMDAVAYKTPESLVDESTKIKASTPGTRRVTFDAIKLAARVIFSEEMTEDSLVPVLPYIKDRIVEALAIAEEQAVINGDLAPAPHQDVDIIDPLDARWSWQGLRMWARTSGAAGTGAEVNLGVFNTAGLRNIRRAMGVYGVDPSRLAWITGICGYNLMMTNADVLTVDRYGPNATILKGELGKFDAIPIIVSEYIREDLDATGVYSAAGNVRTIILLVYKNAFMFGDRRKVTLKTKEDIEVDQVIGVATQRLDYQGLYNFATEFPVGAGINVGPC